MMKSIRTDFLIRQVAENLSTKFQMQPKEISTFTIKLLSGVVHPATVGGNLKKEFKHRYGFRISCPKCGKKVKDIKLHSMYKHRGKLK